MAGTLSTGNITLQQAYDFFVAEGYSPSDDLSSIISVATGIEAFNDGDFDPTYEGSKNSLNSLRGFEVF